MVKASSQTEGGASVDLAFARLFEQLSDRLLAGETVDQAELTSEYPQYAEKLAELLPTIRAVASVGRPAALEDHRHSGEQRTLGDFRLIREIGRGGMGVVYEAEQISLGRSVALKVLPFAAVLDDRQLQRFKTEARAAASLHHTNIVPVFSVGCERGVHYYAMQFIEGHSLAEVIRDLRSLAGLNAPGEAGRAVSDITSQYAQGAFAPTRRATTAQELEESRSVPASGISARDVSEAAADTQRQPNALLNTDPATNRQQHFRSVARLGIQAAEALAHAHTQGILHRDIKPANLLLDAKGNLWITDFGLARMGADSGMTMTGDLLGTLRYMSPEQASGSTIDERSDVYSLGATLYELLTLQPVICNRNREAALKQVALGQPARPRQLNRAIPRDLETILLTAIAREPADRYAEAQQLADDLRRFLEHRTISAKRPSASARAMRWIRRNRALSLAAAVLACSIVAVPTLVWVAHDRTAREASERAARLSAEQGARHAAQVAREAEGWGRWAVVHYRKRDLHNAIDCLDKAIALDRSNSFWGLFRTQCFSEVDHLRRVIDGLSKDIADDPSEPAPYEDRGDCYRQVGDLVAAAKDYRRLAELEQGYVDHGRVDALRLTRLGVAHYRLGHWAATLATFERMNETPDRDVWDNMATDRALFSAMAHWQIGDTETALAEYETALAAVKAKTSDDASHRYSTRIQAEASELLGLEARKD